MRDIDQIDWDKVLRWQDFEKKRSVFQKLCVALTRLGSFLFSQAPDCPSHIKGKVLCIKSLFRPDYEDLWEKVCACLPSNHIISELKWTRGPRINLARKWCCIRLACGLATTRHACWLDRFLCLASSIYPIEVIFIFKDCRPVAVLTFAEMQSVENALMQWFNSKGVPTASVQHGLYIEYPETQTVYRTNYECSCCRYFLAWGQETGELIRRYNPDVELVICGTPQIDNIIKEKQPACIYVVFDADINIEENRILLEVGKRAGQAAGSDVIVCLHPRNEPACYDFSGCVFRSPEDDYSRTGPVIGHTTTQLIKLAHYGKRVFKLKSVEPCNSMIPESVQFSGYDDLACMIAQEAYPHEWSHVHIAYMGSESLSRYVEFFKRWVTIEDVQ